MTSSPASSALGASDLAMEKAKTFAGSLKELDVKTLWAKSQEAATKNFEELAVRGLRTFFRRFPGTNWKTSKHLHRGRSGINSIWWVDARPLRLRLNELGSRVSQPCSSPSIQARQGCASVTSGTGLGNL